jgi:DNA-binding NarL/FixJ family response regulator
MRVMIVDDHSSVRRALRQLIELHDGFEVVGGARTVRKL